MTSPQRTRSERPRGGRQRASHSMEAVLTEAIALLDEAGESGLTFRALAARLGGGVASVYWYVSSKDELFGRATEEVMGRVLERSRGRVDGPDPIANLRVLSLELFAELVRRPWFGAHMLRNSELQPNEMLMFDLLGQQVMRLDLTPRQCFHAVSSITSYVIGVAADLAQPPPPEFVESGLDRGEFLAAYAERWLELDAETHPFAHHVAAEMAVHDDEDVFRSGLDLLLAGLRLQAEH